MPDQTPPFDTGNTVLKLGGPARMKTGLLRFPDGIERVVMTVYGECGEITVALGYDDAAAWIRVLSETHAEQSKVTAGGQVPPPGPVPQPGTNGAALPGFIPGIPFPGSGQ